MDKSLATLLKLIAAVCSTIASAQAALTYARRLGWI
jgi:hypothetical protein